MTLTERLLAALYISEGWYENWNIYRNNDCRIWRRYALYSKLRSVIVYDRVMAGENPQNREVM